MRTESELKQAGFTDSGLTRYHNAAVGYCEELYTKAIALGDRDKANDTPREVTHEHVRDAASEIAIRGRDAGKVSNIWCQIGEYLCTATAGVATGKLDKQWGIILFGVSIAVGIALFVTRNTRKG